MHPIGLAQRIAQKLARVAPAACEAPPGPVSIDPPGETYLRKCCIKYRTGLANIIVLRTTPFVLHIMHYFVFTSFPVYYTANKQTVLRSIPPPTTSVHD